MWHTAINCIATSSSQQHNKNKESSFYITAEICRIYSRKTRGDTLFGDLERLALRLSRFVTSPHQVWPQTSTATILVQMSKTCEPCRNEKYHWREKEARVSTNLRLKIRTGQIVWNYGGLSILLLEQFFLWFRELLVECASMVL